MQSGEITAQALALFPDKVKKTLAEVIGCQNAAVREIRLYRGAPLMLVTSSGNRFVLPGGRLSSFAADTSLTADAELLKTVMLTAVGDSFYQYKNELDNGYITVKNGIRIGICCDSGTVFSADRITSLNIRLPYTGTVHLNLPVEEWLADGGVLCVGPPCSGKTTFLRAVRARLGDMRSGRAVRVCVVDTTGELVHGWEDDPFCSADRIVCADKADGIRRAIRFMSPQLILCDEIGSRDEARSMLDGVNSGVRFIAAMHAGSIGELVRNDRFRLLFSDCVFYRTVLFNTAAPGIPVAVYDREDIIREIYQHNTSVRGSIVYGDKRGG